MHQCYQPELETTKACPANRIASLIALDMPATSALLSVIAGEEEGVDEAAVLDQTSGSSPPADEGKVPGNV